MPVSGRLRDTISAASHRVNGGALLMQALLRSNRLVVRYPHRKRSRKLSEINGEFMCPQCGSNVLLVKHATGFERFLVGLTGKRAYRCRLCQFTFRMPDRRISQTDEASIPDRRDSSRAPTP